LGSALCLLAGARAEIPDGVTAAGLGRHVPNDPLFAEQWYLDNPAGADIDAPEAWFVTTGSARVVIAVLDDGVESQHRDLAPNIVSAGRAFFAAGSAFGAHPRHDRDSHGTAVAGLAAARGDNALGIAGACPACSILPIRVDRESAAAIAAAFRYAVEQGADVIANSWGFARAARPDDYELVRAAVEHAAAQGVTVVFGVSNEAVDNCAGPDRDIAALAAVVAVGVADHNDLIGGSGFGECIDLVAPAKPRYRNTVGVLTTDRSGAAGYADGGYHGTFGGTSAAAPLVAGVAGLLLSLNPDLAPDEVQRVLEHTADKIDPANADYNAQGFSTRAGFGRLNAGRAVRPDVQISVTPAQVAIGETFSITVTASAPHGIDRVSWRGIDTVEPYFAWRQDELAAAPTHYTRTWTDLLVHEEGTFRFEAKIRDAEYRAGDNYPHFGQTRNDTVAGLLTVQGVSQ
jgi:subtilisin family serine protease